MTGCGGHSPIEPDPVGAEGRPIQFGITSHLEVESKAVIDGENYKNHSFTALGNLTVDEVQQTNIFGAEGAEVSFDPATNGNAGAWTYSPLRYWQTGSYFFAGVMPSEAGAASFTETNELTLTFASGGFSLAEAQADLMVAFDAQTVQSTSAATPVNFNFQHQLALVIIKGVNKESMGKIRIDKVEVYGNTAKTDGNMVFTYDGSSIDADYELDPESVTDADNVYQTFTGSWVLSPSTTSTEIVSGLLVFPEYCDFSIVVTYTDYYGDKAGVQTTKSKTLASQWERGKKYTYTFGVSLDDIIFGEPTVQPWDNTGVFDSGIEM